MEKLKNFGIQTVGENKNIKNIIIVGVARSGTSLIAGVLDKLGIFTGEKSRSPVFEDVLLAEYMEKEKFYKVKKIISKYDKKHKIWAFKRPSIINYLEKMHNLWTEPYYIFIFKDSVSIANRNNISMNIDFLNNLISNYKDMGKIINFIEKNKLNAMFLSYEKIILNPDKFVNELVSILKLDVEKEKINSAINFINPNPTEYLDKARITKTIGQVDNLSKNKISGWVKYLYKKEPVEVSLYINGEFIKKTKADVYRKDLEKKVHPTGKCGFVFELKNIQLKPTDKIEIKAEDDLPLKFGKKAREFFIRGFVDKIKKNKIAGWAIDFSNIDESLNIYLYVNGEKVQNSKADKFRRDIKNKMLHPTGNCGFVFKLKKDIKENDKIVVRVKDEYVLNFTSKNSG